MVFVAQLVGLKQVSIQEDLTAPVKEVRWIITTDHQPTAATLSACAQSSSLCKN